MKCSKLSGGHDWALVPQPEVAWHMQSVKLLWACPCGEFRWTGYAEWELAQSEETPTPMPFNMEVPEQP